MTTVMEFPGAWYLADFGSEYNVCTSVATSRLGFVVGQLLA